ncbi:MAG: TIGR03618 family F420-dependent PPOX class oxidoreductase, partial [Candidatus Rokuibacteriota bacterium]
MANIPDGYKDILQKKAFANLATVSSDGSPQVTPVWVDYDGTHIRFNTAKGRVKDRNLRRNPKVALSIQDPDNPYRYLQVRGRVADVTESGADAHIDSLAKKYLGQDKYPYRQPGEVRVIYKIAPDRVQTMGERGGGEPAAMIALDSVSKGYGGQELLRDCTWRIGRGERIGL